MHNYKFASQIIKNVNIENNMMIRIIIIQLTYLAVVLTT